MPKKYHNYIVIPFVNYKGFYLDEVIDLVENRSIDIPNKYLYLGYHGAKLWDEIDVNYKPGKDGGKLIEKHFQSIDSEIRNHTKSYNIVSLGCGSGEDDILILKMIQKKFKKQIPEFRIYTVDLSDDLLEYGTYRITNFINNNAQVRLNSSIEGIYAIWADFKDLSKHYPYLSKEYFLGSRPNLFHLLGLTIGNNNEINLLKWIYNFMNVNDYLLIGIDYSVDGDIKSAFKEYTEGDAREAINKFLCGPLLFSSFYDFEIDPNKIKHFVTFPEVEIEHKPKDERQISKINEAISFTRYHHYSDHGSRLCDFSTKYKSKEFENFIKHILPLEDVYFKIISSKLGLSDEEESSQALVLLKKIDFPNQTSDSKKIDEEKLEHLKSTLINQIKISLNDNPDREKKENLLIILKLAEGCKSLSKIEMSIKIMNQNPAFPTENLLKIKKILSDG